MKYFLLILILIFCNKIVYSNNLFETPFYKVEFISNSIENDKIQKIQEIKKISISNIFRDTLDYEDYNMIMLNTSNDFINSFIKNIIINDERIVNDKYISKVKINFDKKKIIKFYREKKLPYIEYLPNKILLIIYEDNQLKYDLFSVNNNFYSYFKDYLSNKSIFKIPNLDINDRFILKKDHIINKDIEKTIKFAKKYEVNQFVVVTVKTNNNDIISYDLILYSDGQIKEKKIKSEDYKLDIFFQNLEMETLNIWKELNHVQNTSLNLLSCKVSYFNMQELKEIRNKLNDVTIIKNLSIKSLSYKNIEYDIHYYGNLKILLNIFKINHLKVNIVEKLCKITLT